MQVHAVVIVVRSCFVHCLDLRRMIVQCCCCCGCCAQLLRDLPGFMQNVRELPFCCPYSVKARALLHAHFDRRKLPSKTLDPGAHFIFFSPTPK